MHHAEGTEGAGEGAGLLPQFPPGRVDRPLPPDELAAGELPEAPEESVRRPTLDQVAAVALQRDHRDPEVGPGRGRGAPGQRSGVGELLPGAAAERHRAVGAVGPAGEADAFAELHERLGERSRRPRREFPFQALPEPAADLRSADVAGLPGPSSGDAEDVRVQRNDREAERDRPDRAGGVRSDAREALELLDRPGEHPVALRDEPSCRRVEAPRSPVVAGALPYLQHDLEVRLGEPRHVREAGDEPLEVRARLLDTGLLEQGLGDPDPIRVRRDPPGERPADRREPPEQGPDDPGADAVGPAGAPLRHARSPPNETHP